MIETINAMVDVSIDGGVKIAGKNKDGANIFIDLTFGYFKLAIGEIATGTQQTKPSKESMKMIFEQLKTQLKDWVKSAKEAEKEGGN